MTIEINSPEFNDDNINLIEAILLQNQTILDQNQIILEGLASPRLLVERR